MPNGHRPKASRSGLPREGIESVAEVRRTISEAKRDFAGFIEGDQPDITEDQFRWVSYRMSFGSDIAALDHLNAGLPDLAVPWNLDRIRRWRDEPAFTAVEQIALGNKREGVRVLSVHLAGKALRQISTMLDSNDPKIVIRALTLWFRLMGLLVDKVTLVGKDDLQRLAERLMTPITVTPIEGPSIVEGEWTESPRLSPPSDTPRSSET